MGVTAGFQGLHGPRRYKVLAFEILLRLILHQGLGHLYSPKSD